MSGNFVQRGEAAIIEKWDRARIAVDCGVNLVLELPFPFSMASAEYFAKAGVCPFLFGNFPQGKVVVKIQVGNLPLGRRQQRRIQIPEPQKMQIFFHIFAPSPVFLVYYTR